jgi:hypothetical protein
VIFLRPESIKRPIICRIHVLLRANGLVRFDDAEFSSYEKLKVRLAAYKQQNPDCFLSMVSGEGVQSVFIERVGRVMHEAGFSSIGVLTEPHAVSR